MAKKTAAYGLLVALAFLCAYIEYLLPLPFGVPGMKLGLANVVIVTALYLFGVRTAAAVSAVRILLNAFTFGTLYGMLYSVAGALLSFSIMALLYRHPVCSAVGVSTLGGICHNIGQLAVACVFLGVRVMAYYLPILLLCGAVTGFLIGVATRCLLPRLQQFRRDS